MSSVAFPFTPAPVRDFFALQEIRRVAKQGVSLSRKGHALMLEHYLDGIESEKAILRSRALKAIRESKNRRIDAVGQEGCKVSLETRDP